MPTINAGASATITLPAGRTFAYSGGSGSVLVYGPGPAAGQPYALQSVGTLGPFGEDRQLYVSAATAVTYSTDGPVTDAGLTAAQIAAGATGVAGVTASGTLLAAGGAEITELGAFVPDVGAATVETTSTAWTPALSAAARLWYSAEDALNASGSVAAAGDTVQTIPNRLSTTSRTDSLPMPLVARAPSLAAGSAANRPVKRNGNLLNGYMPVSFGAVVGGGTSMRLATQAGALSTNGVYRIFAVAAMRGTSFPYLFAVHTTTGNSLIGGNGSRQIRIGTDSQIAGSFTDSTHMLLSMERPGTEPLFDNTTALSAAFCRINGARTTSMTLATSQETANLGFVVGNRGDVDVATDVDLWEVIVCEGKMTSAAIHRIEGYLAHKYALAASLPGDHPYRSSPPTVPTGTTTRPDFDVVTAPWGYRQVCQGYMYEIQGDNIQANDGAQGADQSRAIPYDLKPTERTRMATLMKAGGTGPGIMRAAAGLYFRGVRSINGTSSLQDGVSMERIPGQRKLVYEFLRDSGTDGIHWEYWSPAPHWKTTSDWALGTLWAGGANPRATTLDSIRVSDPTGYNNQIDALTTAMVADMVDAHTHPTYPIRVTGFGLQNEPLGAPASYGSCTYTAQLYVDVLKSVAAKIRANASLATWGGKPNRVEIHATSWGGPADTIGIAIAADATARAYLDYWTVHQMSTFNADANAMLTGNGVNSDVSGQPYYNFRVASSNPTGIACPNNEYEFFSSLGRPAQFANLACVWLNFLNWLRAPFVTLIHAAKPSTDTVCERYALFPWRVPGDNGAPVSADYAAGLDYGEFGIADVNYNAAVPFLRWLKGAQWLQTHEAAYSATRKVGACITANGRLVVFVLNTSTSSATMTISLGREIRRMRPINYSATARDEYASANSVLTNVLTAAVPAQTLQVWVEV